jgi:hypothetical protein
MFLKKLTVNKRRKRESYRSPTFEEKTAEAILDILKLKTVISAKRNCFYCLFILITKTNHGTVCVFLINSNKMLKSRKTVNVLTRYGSRVSEKLEFKR